MNILMIVMGLFALLAVGAYLAGAFSEPREKCANAYSEQPHPCGKIAREFLVNMPSPYLLAKTGAGGTADICGSIAEPLGPCMDTPVAGERGTILHLGAVKGTVTLVAGSAIPNGARVYTSGAGKVGPTANAGTWLVGRAIEAAAGNGSLVEVAPCFPVEQ